jgi:glutamate synthase (NADPH/NADH) large chain/glutamate synthase (ferredoxin)
MMRKCHLNTCPVGVATQDPELRKRFTGKPEHVVNFFLFVAEEIRGLMAQLGFRTMREMIGRVDKLKVQKAVDHWKAKGLDLSLLLTKPQVGPEVATSWVQAQDHGLAGILDNQLVARCQSAIERGEPVSLELPIRNLNRTTGTVLSSHIARRYGPEGLPPDTIRIKFTGSAGQSFGAFLSKGITLTLEGESNDYLGKGLSGGKIIVVPPPNVTYSPEETILIGNTSLYGATAGEGYFYGTAGERFAVRNSGARVVIDGTGDHGCEYMTGGVVVILGKTGRNFAAGMSGGEAYVLDEEGTFPERCNMGMVEREGVEASEDIQTLRTMIEAHFRYTQSENAKRVLDAWDVMLPKFVKVMPRDYKRVLQERKAALAKVHAQREREVVSRG